MQLQEDCKDGRQHQARQEREGGTPTHIPGCFLEIRVPGFISIVNLSPCLQGCWECKLYGFCRFPRSFRPPLKGRLSSLLGPGVVHTINAARRTTGGNLYIKGESNTHRLGHLLYIKDHHILLAAGATPDRIFPKGEEYLSSSKGAENELICW